MQFIFFIFIGIFTGILSGIFGIGGGIVLVPVLVYVFQLTQQQASGVSLVAMLLPVGLLGAYQYFKAGVISGDHIRTGFLIATGMFAGSYWGARIAIIADGQILRRGFAMLLVATAIKIWFK